jgi:hypothetical protein
MLGAAVAQEKAGVVEAPVEDVMFDQLEFLMTHSSPDCPYCEDCQRLLAVKAILLQPFQEGTCRQP